MTDKKNDIPAEEVDPKVVRHQVDAVTDPKLFPDADVNAPIPKSGDPYAHQREDAPEQEEAKQIAKDDAKAKKAEK